MKASAFDVAQTTLATPYLNSTASAIDILFDMEHHARDVVLGAFVREAARDDDPSTLLDYSGVVPAMTQIQKYLYWRQAATVGAANRFGDWSFRKSKALYMNVDTALKARKKEALATGAGDAPLDGGAVVAQVEDGESEKGAVTIFPEHTELFRRYLRARVLLFFMTRAAFFLPNSCYVNHISRARLSLCLADC